MKYDKNIIIYPFDKGKGFAVIKEEDAIHKIEEKNREIQSNRPLSNTYFTEQIPKKTS